MGDSKNTKVSSNYLLQKNFFQSYRQSRRKFYYGDEEWGGGGAGGGGGE